ncbi:MetQ/NlpA family ABC transporter substrate-binding protein, partial [Fusobacterium sp.]|uniref:MetQ/NlpA family ABC transporter substrate-binding protein n=1 Tax=Fusobacterium sp. TaxID=68766 RepID=UPI0025BA4A0C
VANTHVEPLGLYSKKVKSVNDLKKGDVVAIPSDPSNGGRALILLHNNGVITLKDPTNLYATEFDIVKNPKNLKFKPVEAPQLPRVLKDVSAAVINSNYALEAGLNTSKDAILVEGKESPYANIIVVKAGNEKNEDIQKLIKALHTEKVKKFINEKYNGAVVPAF